MVSDVKLVDVVSDEKTANQIAELLTDIAGDLSDRRGGHIPDEIVQSIILKTYTSVESVRTTFAKVGHRFVVVNEAGDVIGTVLVAKEPDTVLAKNSMTPFCPAAAGEVPPNLHSIFNLAVRRDYRRRGVARRLFQSLGWKFRSNFSGEGVWARSEPPDHEVFCHLGFSHVAEYDEYFEPGVSCPSSFDRIERFNDQFMCSCPRSEYHRMLWRQRKYKYGSFTIRFDDLRT